MGDDANLRARAEAAETERAAAMQKVEDLRMEVARSHAEEMRQTARVRELEAGVAEIGSQVKELQAEVQKEFAKARAAYAALDKRLRKRIAAVWALAKERRAERDDTMRELTHCRLALYRIAENQAGEGPVKAARVALATSSPLAPLQAWVERSDLRRGERLPDGTYRPSRLEELESNSEERDYWEQATVEARARVKLLEDALRGCQAHAGHPDAAEGCRLILKRAAEALEKT